MDHDRETALHVGGPDAVHAVALDAGAAVVLDRNGVEMPVEGHQRTTRLLADDEAVAQTLDGLHGEDGKQSLRDRSADAPFVAGHRRDVDEVGERLVECAHTWTSKTRRASLRDVLRSVEAERLPMINAHWSW